MIANQTFGQAIEALKQGRPVTRPGLFFPGKFIFRQVPCEVPAEVIPRMSSLPAAVKDLLSRRGKPITYEHQFCIVNKDNTIHGWLPDGADILATDWCIFDKIADAEEPPHTGTPHPAADTVGTGVPLE